MGPEKLLMRVPITLNAGDFTCANIWLVPILKKYVVGASLGYYMEHIMPLAKSFQRASHKGIFSTLIWNILSFFRHGGLGTFFFLIHAANWIIKTKLPSFGTHLCFSFSFWLFSYFR